MFRGVYTEEEGVGVDKGIKGDLSAEAVLREGGVAGRGRGGKIGRASCRERVSPYV